MPSTCSVVDLEEVTAIMTFVFFFHRWNHFSSVHHSWSQGNHILESWVESSKRTRLPKFRFTKVLCTGYKEYKNVISVGYNKLPYFTFLFLHTDVFLQDDRKCLMGRKQNYRISGTLSIKFGNNHPRPHLVSMCVLFHYEKYRGKNTKL